jgi:plasmid stability protein
MQSLQSRKNNTMATNLVVRNIDEAVVQALKQAAAAHGRSAEAEHREILRTSLMTKPPRRSLADVLASMPLAGTDEDFNWRP